MRRYRCPSALRTWLIGASVLILVGCGTSKNSATAAETLREPDIAGLTMISQKVGWAVTTQGKHGRFILRTINGGSTWTNVTPPGSLGPGGATINLVSSGAEHALDLVVPLSRSGKQGGLRVYHTSDGGQAWKSSVGSVRGIAGQLDVVTDRVAFLLVNVSGGLAGNEEAAVIRTVDGGVSWQTITPGSAGSVLFGGDKNGIAFLNRERGYITGQTVTASILLYATHNGGVTWEPQQIPVPKGWVLQPAAEQSYPPMFFGKRQGILPVAIGRSMAFYVTDNGGMTWTPGAGIIGHGPSVTWSFPNANYGFATGGSALYRTTNGGRAWSNVRTNVSLKGITELDFVSDNHGWAIIGRRLLKTTDAGSVWRSAL